MGNSDRSVHGKPVTQVAFQPKRRVREKKDSTTKDGYIDRQEVTDSARKEPHRMSTHRHFFQFTGANDEVVLEFFVTFSRFEYALKRAQFVKGDKHHNAQPDWCRFAREVAGRLDDVKDEEFKGAKSYLLQNPPRKQVLRDKSMSWEANCKRNQESEGQYLLRLVRDVRNNLFHGGKYDQGSVDDHSLRNNDLLKASLTILDWCLQLDGTLASYFSTS